MLLFVTVMCSRLEVAVGVAVALVVVVVVVDVVVVAADAAVVAVVATTLEVVIMYFLAWQHQYPYCKRWHQSVSLASGLLLSQHCFRHQSCLIHC